MPEHDLIRTAYPTPSQPAPILTDRIDTLERDVAHLRMTVGQMTTAMALVAEVLRPTGTPGGR